MEPTMDAPKTLLQLSAASLAPAKLREAALILIDLQNEYLAGPIAVEGAEAALAAAKSLLDQARHVGAPVFHIAHKGRTGGMFDRDHERGQFVPILAPQNEAVIEKGLPNSFAATDLAARLNATGRKELIMVGFMTHMCVSSTARAALDLGYRVTIDANGCATRALPDGLGGTIPAHTVHTVALAELSDRFAIIVRDPSAFA
jgi:nicotinamidase-related amidase